jgi:hypothetical protein
MTETVVSGLLGLGWLTTVAALWKERAKQRQLVMTYLIQRRQALDNDPDLLGIVGLLRREARAAANHEPPPKDEEGRDGSDLRNLPAFLEPIGTYLAYSRGAGKRAYGVFAQEVLLCHHSKLLWADERPPYSDDYWRSFKQFARFTEARGFQIAQ